ncbi:MAG: PAS domain-containing protein [Firmicutes bacterium]|nr:PAS domain-containing protein [Bacillota bacterium]
MRRELEVILDSTHDAMIAVNKKGIITLFNKAAERLTGIDSHYALNKPVKKVILNTRLMYILETGDFELNRQQDLGDIKIITNRMPVKNEDGEIIGAVAVFRDITDILDLAEEITDLKEIKSMLEGVFHSTQDAITVVNKEGINLMVNPAYTKLTGLSESDVIGKLATTDIAEGESIHLKVLETKKSVVNARLKVGPNRKEVLATAAPITVDGELRGSVAVLHDVTEIISLTNELKVAKEIIRKLEARYTFDDIVGGNDLVLKSIEKAKKAAELPATVLLRGESGTGKELFAHAIHNESFRKYNQFVRVNCAALSEDLLESELFGYEEGAFTGAKKGGKKGLFEQASGGTIFLDEIGEISLNTQVKLLRVLQEWEIVRVGGTKPIDVDVRVIAATNMDLEKAIKKGRFREDLFYRINVIPIEIPPLRKRKDDLYSLSINCIKKLNQEYGRNVEDISNEAIDILKKHYWPGNVRELENVIGRAIINMKLCEKIIKPNHIPKFETVEETQVNIKKDKKSENLDKDILKLKEVVKNTEKRHIIKVLNSFNQNKTETAKALGISIRSLYYKMDKYGIKN